jgi:hypothetical protein
MCQVGCRKLVALFAYWGLVCNWIDLLILLQCVYPWCLGTQGSYPNRIESLPSYVSQLGGRPG